MCYFKLSLHSLALRRASLDFVQNITILDTKLAFSQKKTGSKCPHNIIVAHFVQKVKIWCECREPSVRFAILSGGASVRKN